MKLFHLQCNDPVVIHPKLVFIQIPKTGSTSLYREMIRLGLTVRVHCYRHEGIVYLQAFLRNTNQPIYTVVRNPFSHVLSYFFHQLRHGEITHDPSRSIQQEFRDYCRRIIPTNVHVRQSAFLHTNDSAIRDRIYYFKMEDGIDNIVHYLNKHHDLTMETRHENKNSIQGYDTSPQFLHDVYDKETEAWVRTHLATEFSMFHYSSHLHDVGKPSVLPLGPHPYGRDLTDLPPTITTPLHPLLRRRPPLFHERIQNSFCKK